MMEQQFSALEESLTVNTWQTVLYCLAQVN